MDETKSMERCSNHVDSCSRAGTGGRIVDSVATAEELTRGLGELLAPRMPTKSQIDKVYRELSKMLPKLTRRRVRAFFFGEVARVDYEEMRALEELRAVEEARREHREFTATTNRLAAALASEGASLSRKQMDALARIQSRYADVPRPADTRSGIARRYVAAPGARDAA